MVNVVEEPRGTELVTPTTTKTGPQLDRAPLWLVSGTPASNQDWRAGNIPGSRRLVCTEARASKRPLLRRVHFASHVTCIDLDAFYVSYIHYPLSGLVQSFTFLYIDSSLKFSSGYSTRL